MKFDRLYKLLTEIVLDTSTKQLLLCGGSYGHLFHPFEDVNLSFNELKDIITKALTGMKEFEDIGEKLDGVNLMFTFKDGELKFARNAKQLKDPVSLSQFEEFIHTHDKTPKHINDMFIEVASMLTKAAKTIDKAFLEKTLDNGHKFVNLEIIDPNVQNVIDYKDNYLLRFQTLNSYDKNFAKSSAKPIIIDDPIVARFKHADGKYKIVGKDKLSLQCDPGLKSKIPEYLNKLDKIKKDYDLDDTSKIRDILAKENSNIDKIETSKRKELLYPLEILFLKLGNAVIAGCKGSLGSDKDVLKKNLESDIAKIKASGDDKAKEKLEYEMKKLADLDNVINDIEGIVFTYKGKEYKLTGSFAPINQLHSIAKKIDK